MSLQNYIELFWKTLAYRQIRTVCILHGNVNCKVNYLGDIEILDINEKSIQSFKTTNSLYLLASPYTISYINKSIPLKKKELVHADNHLLEFSRFSKEGRILESFILDDQNTLNIFSHISEEGRELLERLKSPKRRLSWQPAISFFVRQILNSNAAVLKNHQNTNLIFAEEILQFEQSERIPNFKHVFFWTKNESIQASISRSKTLFAKQKETHSPIDFNFVDQSSIKTDSHRSISEIIFPVEKSNNYKWIRTQTKKASLPYLKRIPLKSLAFLITVITLVWASYLEYNIYQLKNERRLINIQIEMLKNETQNLENFSLVERKKVKTDAILAAAKATSLDPIKELKKIESIMPEHFWIESMGVNHAGVDIQLLSSKSISTTKIFKRLKKEYRQVQLTEKAEMSIEGQLITQLRYSMRTSKNNDH